MFLIFIIVSDLLSFEMTLPSVASCDSALTHPPFVASSRPPKNLRNEPRFFDYVKQINSIRKSSIFDGELIFLELNPPFGCFAFSEDQSRFLSHLRMLCLYITSDYSAFRKSHARHPALSEDLCRHLSHLRMTCLPFASQSSAFPTSLAGRLAFSEDLCRFLSHLRMPCFNLTSYHSFIAVSYRSVHVIRVSTRQILALRGLCAYRVFDPRFVSCWPMFADLSVVRRRSALCLLKLCFRLRQTQNRIQKIYTSRTIRFILLF